MFKFKSFLYNIKIKIGKDRYKLDGIVKFTTNYFDNFIASGKNLSL